MKITVKPGTFHYSVARFNPAIDESLWDDAGKPNLTDIGMALEARRVARQLCRAIVPNVSVEYGVGKIGTDHSYWRNGRPVIVLDATRLYSNTKQGTVQVGGITKGRFGSLVGAAVHEVSHSLYTPRTVKMTPKQTAAFRTYEDVYVNAVASKSRLPGAAPYLTRAYNWTNPLDAMAARLSKYTAHTTFDAALSALTCADLMGRRINRAAHLTVPSEAVKELIVAVGPVSNRLASGKEFPWETRLKMYQRIVEIIEGLLPATPPAPEQEQEPGDAGKGKGKGAGTGESEEHAPSEGGESTDGTDGDGADGSGDGDDADGDGDGDGAASTDGNGQGSGNSTERITDEAGDENETESQALSPLEARDVDTHCDEQSAKDGATDANVRRWAQNTAREAEKAGTARDADGVNIRGVDYFRAEKNPYARYGDDPRRVAELRKAFTMKSNERRALRHGEHEGRISQRRVTQIVTGTSSNVFKARPQFNQKAGVVMILVDGSGSMKGANWDEAQRAAVELHKAIAGNPDYTCYVWSYTSGGFFNSGSNLVVDGGWLDGSTYVFPSMRSGGTPSHHAMATAAEFLNTKHRGQNRVILHLTDLGWGTPSADATARFERELTHTPGIQHLTVSVCPAFAGDTAKVAEYIGSMRQASPEMNISLYPADELAPAVAEFVRQAL